MATENYNYQKLQKVLEDIFELNQADLDFGIYRIMNQKREEINDFLNNRLLVQVKEILSQQNGDNTKVQVELDEVIAQAKNLGVVPDTLPRVQELKDKLASSITVDQLEQEVYSHLTNFFKRYYKNGDFISLRRYKKDTYAIPYEGEEVKLHWANHDQYYIKSSEYLKNYSFKLGIDKLVKFELKEASTEQNNNKEQKDQVRLFAIYEEQPYTISEDGKILSINFTYELYKKATKQEKLTDNTLEVLYAEKEILDKFTELYSPRATEKNKKRTLLEKHITDFTARNTFDYFIHKDLGGFLSRELDFYIKNEIFFLDDINTENEIDFTTQISKVKALKEVAGRIIAFLTQIEDFQKKLWLKKKFITNTNYCITLNKVPEKLYGEVISNIEQIGEWKELFDIHNQSKVGDVFTAQYSEPLTIEYLKSQPNLVLDTKYFGTEFKYRLLAEFDNLEETIDGSLIKSDNFQALNLISEKFNSRVESIYIDPPYNTGGDDFLYKDAFQESSWLSMMFDRLNLAKVFFKEGGSFHMSIDIKELDKAILLSDNCYGVENRKSNITIKRGSLTGAKVINLGPINISENLIVYSAPFSTWAPYRALRKKGYDTRYGSIITNINDKFQDWQFSTVLDEFSKEKGIKKSQLKKVLGDEYETILFEWIIKNSDRIIRTASLDEKSVGNEVVRIKKQSIKEPNRIFHLPRENSNDYFIKSGNAILFYKHRLSKIDGQLVPAEPISDIWDDVLPNDLHNEGGVYLRKGKKPEKLLQRVIESSSQKKSIVLDFFLGSGTTTAVSHKMGRKWIGIDSGEYFDNKALKRMKRVLFGEISGISKAEEWKGGGFFKYQHLESYEDALNNLSLKRSVKQNEMLMNDMFKDEYMLSYMLDTESKDSLLDIDAFKNPFNYKLNITRDNETKETVIDLVETFNYLIGLHVRTIETIHGFKVVTGVTNRNNEETLVIWRNTEEKDNKELNEFFTKMEYSTRDTEFDRIYVNGDNLLENLKIGDEKWKVVLIEEEFQKRMFDVENI